MSKPPATQKDGKRGPLNLRPCSLATWSSEAAFYRPAILKPLPYDRRTKKTKAAAPRRTA